VHFADRVGMVLEDIYEIYSHSEGPSKKLFARCVFDESDQEIANEYNLFRTLQLKKIEVDDGLIRKVP
jgi:hypothetical protein